MSEGAASGVREVTIVDVGMGNLRSVARAIVRAGGTPRISGDPEEVRRASRLIIPGQGTFSECARALGGALGEAVRAFIGSGRPYLGICLGMQALLEASEEAPGARGLGLVPGTVRRFPEDLRDPATGERLKVPHMGWNEIEGSEPRLGGGRWFYFVHSFHCEPVDRAAVAATSEHGIRFCAAIARDNILAVQFHPEKSGADGARLLSGFVEGRGWS